MSILAAQIVKAMTSATVNIILEGLATVVMQLRNIPDYDREARAKEREKILAMFNAP